MHFFEEPAFHEYLHHDLFQSPITVTPDKLSNAYIVSLLQKRRHEVSHEPSLVLLMEYIE